MHIEEGSSEFSDAPVGDGDTAPGRPRLSRRQALGRMSAVATAGAAAWVVPEILAAKPAAAAMSSPKDPDNDGDTDGKGGGPDHDGGDHGMMSSRPGSSAGGMAVVSPASMFSPSRHGIVRDAELGGAMVAGGWVFHRWMSRGAASTAASTPQHGPGGGDGDAV